MTDKIKGFVVTLEHDVREDDVQVITQAIEMIRGVASVEPSVSDTDDQMNRARIKSELRGKLYDFLQKNFS